MCYRKDAVALAAAALLACSGLALADGTEVQAPLTLNPSVVSLDEAAPRTLLMSGLDKVGVGKTLDSLGISIYGYIEGGYQANIRDMSGYQNVARNQGRVFDSQGNNRAILNQVDLNIDRAFDPKKAFDVGGKIEIIYGSDADLIHSQGTPLDGDELQNLGSRAYHPAWNADPTQAYVDLSFGQVGNGLVVRAGKFVTFFSYETINTLNNPFYSRSLLFSAVNFTNTGVVAFYKINDQWAVAGGITRGWDEALEDNNGAPDLMGQVTWTPNKQLKVTFNFGTGPEDTKDTAHYRTTLDPVITYQVNDKLSLGAELLYVYDGGYNNIVGYDSEGNAITSNEPLMHSYGDVWGGAFYAKYVLSDMFALNGRFEKLHDFRSGTSINVYEATAGVTITPFPKDPIGKNLMLRPEIRYDFSEDPIFTTGNNRNTAWRDQWTVGGDVIFTF